MIETDNLIKNRSDIPIMPQERKEEAWRGFSDVNR